MTILDEINELLEEEHAELIGSDDAIISSGIDSFGLTMVLMTIGEKYDLWEDDKEFGKIDFAKITPNDIARLIDENSQL
jgi:acyl carrier protein